MEKKEVRKQILRQRKEMPEELHQLKSARIVEHLTEHPLYKQAQLIFTFVPFDHEVDIRPFFKQALQDGKQIAIPLANVATKEMTLYLFEGWEQLESGVYGILEPNPEHGTLANRENIDLIIMPGAAFDRNGGRIGYGGGFYDRFLASLPECPPLLAPCFIEQVIDHVPMEEHDIRVDLVVTDEEIFICNK